MVVRIIDLYVEGKDSDGYDEHDRRRHRMKRRQLGKKVARVKRAQQSKLRPHTSNIVTLAASNCGRFQRERKDPFELREANFTFYEEFEQLADVVGSFAKYEFPVFKPSTSNEGKAAGSNKQVHSGWGEKPAQIQSSSQSTQLSMNANLSQGSEAKPSLPPPSINAESNKSPLDLANTVIASTSSHRAEQSEVASSELYLTGMTHSESPAGLLPLFSSWSLVSIGKYTDYNPNLGAGFHFLLYPKSFQ